MVKKILIVLICLIFISAGSYFYLKNVFVPVHLKQFLSQKVQTQLDRRLEFASIKFDFLNGIIIQNITLYNKESLNEPLITIPKISLRLLLPNILRGQLILIPTLTVEKPQVYLRRLDNKQWNFSDLLIKPRSSQNRKPNPFIPIIKLIINQGQTHFADFTSPQELPKTIDKINIQVQLRLGGSIQFRVALSIPEDSATIDAQGVYKFTNQTLSANLALKQLHLSRYLNTFYMNDRWQLNQAWIPSAQAKIIKENNTVTVKGNAEFDGEYIFRGKKFQGHFFFNNLAYKFKNNSFSLSTAVESNKASFDYPGKVSLTGSISSPQLTIQNMTADMAVKGKGIFNITAANWNKDMSFNGIGELDHFSFLRKGSSFQIRSSVSTKKINFSNNNKDIHFEGNIQTDRFSFDENSTQKTLKSNLINVTNAKIKTSKGLFDGTLIFSKPDAKIADQKFFLKTQISAPQTYLKVAPDVFFKGNPKMNLDLVYPLPSQVTKKTAQQYSGTLILEDAAIKGLPNIGLITGINGDIHFKTDKFATKNLKFNALDSSFLLNGTMANFNDPLVNVHMKSRKIDLQKLNSFLKPFVKRLPFEPFGDAALTLKYKGSTKILNEDALSGSLLLKEAQLKEVPQVKEINNLSGQIKFQNGKIKTDLLEFITLNSNLKLNGSLESFEEPFADIEVSSLALDLKAANVLINTLINKSNISTEGSAATTLNYKGPIKKFDKSGLLLSSQFQNAQLKFANHPDPITQISGNANYKNNGLIFKDLKCVYQERPFTLNGTMKNPLSPILNLRLDSDNLFLQGQIKIKNSLWSLTNLKGQFYNSNFSLNGNVDFLKEGNIGLDLVGKADVRLEDIKNFSPKVKEKLKSLNPKGQLAANFSYKGRKDDFFSGNLSLTATSPRLTLFGYDANNVNASLEKNKNEYLQLKANGSFYDGPLLIQALIDIENANYPMQLSAQLENLQLAQLKEEKQLKNDNLVGELSVVLSAEGSARDIRSLKGKGALIIEKGNIYQFSILKGIWGSLLIPEFKRIVFTEAKGSFTIENGQMNTKDLFLKSAIANLYVEGWVDLDKNINLNVAPAFKESEIIKSISVLKKLPTSIITQTKGYINIKVTGTIDKPKYKIDTMPTKLLKKATNALLDGFQGLFEDLLGP